jgi:transposase, IS6 family
MAFAHKSEARLPLGPRFREAFVTTLQVSLHATDRPFACPPRMRTLSFRFDARISPHAGNQLPGTLASPRTGLTPAGCPELAARLHHELLSCGARTAGRTTYAKVAGRWVYLYRAIDQFGQVIDVLVAEKRDLAATRRFFTRALDHGPCPIEVTTDHAATYPRVLDELVPAARHVTEQYGNNPIEADHGRLTSRLRPMRGFKQLRCARVITAGHAFIQNIRRGHYELGTEQTVNLRVPAAFDELVMAI